MSNTDLPKLIVVLGPTASGKSDLAVALALRLRSGQAKKFGINGGEIISADSRQVYRGMNIGTGKITKREMRGIPHCLLDVASPKRRFSAAQYKILAQKETKEILAKRKIPIICGGTGFYIQAITENLQIPNVKPDLKLRARLEKKATNYLYEKLQKLDPRRAENIDPQNRRRLIRAIEIVKTTGQAVPKLETKRLYDVLYIGIKKSPQELKKLIGQRLQKRLRQGMIKEVEKLRRTGVSWKRFDDFGLEYRWIAKFLQKKISRKEMILRLQKEIEHYAKRQMTWFKKNKGILWIDNKVEAENAVTEFMKV